MKNILKLLFLLLVVSSCTKTKSKNYLTISGKIDNKTSDSIIIKSFYKQKETIIKLLPDGSFKDTLKVIDGYHSGLYIGKFFYQSIL